MSTNIDFILYVLAAVCFTIQVTQPWTGWGVKINWVALGLLFWVLTAIIN